MTPFTWDDMNFWDTGEWQALEERLEDRRRAGVIDNPNKENLFAALDITEFQDVRVVFAGQDPYPEHRLATGLAFSIPKGIRKFPPSLDNIFAELSRDLHTGETPKSGDLSKWAKQGVLLWNVIPTCEDGKSMSHAGWDEWQFLTKEIFERLSERRIVFALIGSVAREYAKYINQEASAVIEVSHPSPRGQKFGRHPFVGSRIFTTINDKLNEKGLKVIDWRL